MKNRFRTVLKSFGVICIIMMTFLIISGCSSGEHEMDETSESTTELSTEEELVVDGYTQINQTKAQKMMDEAVGTGMIREIEYINNDVFYRLRAKLLARKKDHAMVALKLSTFDSDREIETAKEMLSYGNALFSTYELVVMIYPDSNTVNRIYTTHNLPVYDREATIRISLRKFCEAEVAPVDQERYMRFLDFDTLKDRIKDGKRGFISGFFRMCWVQERYNWYVARATLLPSAGEFAIMLTIQALQQKESDCVDRLSHEHPEYFV